MRTFGLKLCCLFLAAAAQAAPVLRISAALPVVGQPVRLSTDADQPATLYLQDTGAPRQLAVIPPGQTVVWQPTTVGPATLTAQVAEQRSEPRTLFVTPRRLQFNYWSCAPRQKYVTSKLLGKGELAEDWLARGVVPLAWKYGQAHPDWTEAGQWVDHWTTALSGTPGVMIDEFGGGDGAKDQVMGQALVAARQRQPGLFLAPYCLGAKGEAMVAGLRASDLVLVETYVNDFRGDRTFDERMASAVAAAGADKVLAVLGLGEWATTHKELRRQVAYLRATRPEMPGLALFGDAPTRLYGVVDRAIYDYYLGPALRLTATPTGAVVGNVGCLPARDVRLTVAGAPQVLPTVAAGTEVAVAGADVRLTPMPGAYTVIERPEPTKAPLPDSREAALAAAWRGQFDLPQALPDAAGLQMLRATEGAPGAVGQVRGATLPLGRSLDGPVSLAFTLDLGKAYFYGRCGIYLEGQGSMGLRWDHGDHDRDVPASQPRVVFEYRGSGGQLARETFAPSLGPERRFQLVMAYDGRGFVRALLLSADAHLLYDTGNLPYDSPLVVDRLRFEVTPWASSEVRAEAGGWWLRGVSGGPEPSPYVLESRLTDLRLACGRRLTPPPPR